MSELVGPYSDPDQYWNALDIAARTEADVYLGLFVPSAARLRGRGRYMKARKNYYKTYSPVQIPGELSDGGQPCQVRLAQRETTIAKTGSVVTKIVAPILHVNSQPDDNRVFVRNIVRPSLLVTESEGQVKAAELANITDLICTPAEDYIAAQKAWIERLAAIDTVLSSGIFIPQQGAA